jgi:Response regulator of the LytR/AlgR family
LLMLLAHYVISVLRFGTQNYYQWPDLPSALQNPVFLSIMIAALSIGSVFVDRLLEKRFPSGPKTITFLSDRKPVTVSHSEIMFVESNDAVTTVHTEDGSDYKNKTPISQWESILGPDFVRIHRAFLVNRSSITEVDKDVLYIGDIELPISRKYKANLKNFL